MLGLGYIGLPTAATLATRGVEVVGVDIKEDAVRKINDGKAHFSEPDLDMLLQSAVLTGKLRAVTEPEEAEVFIIAVPTPFNVDRSPDMSHVEQACRAVAKVAKRGDLIILESTSPVGATEALCRWIGQERPELTTPLSELVEPDINVAYCPERILPGRMVFELVENDRIVGGMTSACGAYAKSFYEIFVRGSVHVTRAPTAELCKLIENAYRDVNIAFANEISNCCDRLGLDPWEAIDLANRHPRVNILNPGPGVGGHCIAVDPWFLISALPDNTTLMRSAREVNDAKPRRVIEDAKEQMRRFKKPVIACLGLAYKPNVDDLRESPAMDVVKALATEPDGRILVVEPNLAGLPKSLTGKSNVEFLELEDALEQCDIVLVLVGHRPFLQVRRSNVAQKIVIDTCGAWVRLP